MQNNILPSPPGAQKGETTVTRTHNLTPKTQRNHLPRTVQQQQQPHPLAQNTPRRPCKQQTPRAAATTKSMPVATPELIASRRRRSFALHPRTMLLHQQHPQLPCPVQVYAATKHTHAAAQSVSGGTGARAQHRRGVTSSPSGPSCSGARATYIYERDSWGGQIAHAHTRARARPRGCGRFQEARLGVRRS